MTKPRTLRPRQLLLAGLLALAAPTAAVAQTQLLGIEGMSRSAISPIYAGNEVKGYLLYTRGDKADRKNDNYLLNFYDQDMQKVKTVTLQKPAGRYFLLRTSFNGTAFGLYFFNLKERTLELETYDTSLKLLATKAIGELSKIDLNLIQQMLTQPNGGDTTFGGLNLFPVPGKGFVRNSADGLMKSYNLQMYDDKLQPKWRLSSDPKSKDYESVSMTEAVDKYVLAIVMRRSGMMSKKLDSYLMAVDAETGKKVLDVPVETSATEQLSLSSFTFDAAKREFLAVGETYLPSDKPFVNKSQGFYIKRFSEAGKAVATRQYSWAKDVKALLPAEAKASAEEGYVNFNHSIVKGADGSLYIVAEQFKIAGRGLDIAMGLAGMGGGGAKGKIGNLLVFALDPQQNLQAIKFYGKDGSNVGLPPSAGMLGTGLLGYVIKGSGGFDYQFLQKNDTNTAFNVVYINYDKEKGEETKKIIGNIGFGNAGAFTLDKIDGSSAATASYVYPAKPGYLLLADFTKKQKILALKLVKLNN